MKKLLIFALVLLTQSCPLAAMEKSLYDDTGYPDQVNCPSGKNREDRLKQRSRNKKGGWSKKSQAPFILTAMVSGSAIDKAQAKAEKIAALKKQGTSLDGQH